MKTLKDIRERRVAKYKATEKDQLVNEVILNKLSALSTKHFGDICEDLIRAYFNLGKSPTSDYDAVVEHNGQRIEVKSSKALSKPNFTNKNNMSILEKLCAYYEADTSVAERIISALDLEIAKWSSKAAQVKPYEDAEHPQGYCDAFLFNIVVKQGFALYLIPREIMPTLDGYCNKQHSNSKNVGQWDGNASRINQLEPYKIGLVSFAELVDAAEQVKATTTDIEWD